MKHPSSIKTIRLFYLWSQVIIIFIHFDFLKYIFVNCKHYFNSAINLCFTGNAGGANFGPGSGGLFGQNNQNKTPLNFGSTPGFGNANPSGGLNFGAGNTGLFGGSGFNTGTSGAFGNMFNAGGGMPQLQQNTPFNTPNNISNNNISNLIKALTHNPFGNSSLLKNGVAPSGMMFFSFFFETV